MVKNSRNIPPSYYPTCCILFYILAHAAVMHWTGPHGEKFCLPKLFQALSSLDCNTQNPTYPCNAPIDLLTPPPRLLTQIQHHQLRSQPWPKSEAVRWKLRTKVAVRAAALSLPTGSVQEWGLAPEIIHLMKTPKWTLKVSSC